MRWYPTEADLDRGIYLDHGVAYVLPALEGPPVYVRRIGWLGVGANFRWSSWSIGFDILKAGLLLQVGPCFFFACHIERQRQAFEERNAVSGQ